VRFLVEQGADLHARDSWNKTALHLAAELGHYDICDYLIRSGADVNATNKNNQTALHYAAREGHPR
ncbi:hypothetical protein GUITHDRAFT_66081, partial [Guillardia theta CCMP2712]